MRKINNELLFSSTDLTKFLGCKCCTHQDHEVIRGRRKKPAWTNSKYDLIRELGLLHEEKYINHLRQKGLHVVDLSAAYPNSHEQTKSAMKAGADIIVQANLVKGNWAGYADVLRKMDGHSLLGDYLYEAVDTKLSQLTKGNSIIQLCLYSDLLEKMQGTLPKQMHVVKPGHPFNEESFYVNNYYYYYQYVKDNFISFYLAGSPGSYPEKVPHCDLCSWWLECNQQRRIDDNLCFVAGMNKGNISNLEQQNITRLQQLATYDQEFERPKSGSVEKLVQLQKQASLQKRSIDQKTILVEYLEPTEEGLHLLPSPNSHDVFFDIESDRFYQNEGLEYMFGIYYHTGEAWKYTNYIGFNRKDEKTAFSNLMKFFLQRHTENPAYRIYHYGHKEPTALKQLAMKHMIYQEDMDTLLRAGKFVDLYSIFKKSFRAGIESYGLKDVEKLLSFTRSQSLEEVRPAISLLQRSLELEEYDKITEKDVEIVSRYNKDDCVATMELRDWLEGKRSELENENHVINRPTFGDGQASEWISEWDQKIKDIYDKLCKDLPEDQDKWNPEHHAKWMLANLVGYYRREFKVKAWENFRLQAMEEEEYVYERKVIANAEYIAKLEPTGKQKNHGYMFLFQEQELSIKKGEGVSSLNEMDSQKFDGSLRDWDEKENTITITITENEKSLGQPIVGDKYHLQLYSQVRNKKIREAMQALGNRIASHIPDDCGWQLLTRAKPRFLHNYMLPKNSDVSGQDLAIESVDKLDRSVLAIQGPPGTGKTHTAAEMIIKLNQQGKKVGVTALSHKVIESLLLKVKELSAKAGHNIVVGKNKPSGKTLHENVNKLSGIDKGLEEDIVTGWTIFGWASQSPESVDYLFVDEAGQLSLANVMAISHSTRNLVLMGDPQQLQQPSQAAHPNGSDVSALKHYIGDKETIAENQGIFLESTWRMHPTITSFTSKLYYEDRLGTIETKNLAQQLVKGISELPSSGLFYLPVNHSHRKNKAVEEIEVIKKLYQSILNQKGTWIDSDGTEHSIGQEQILIIAPYNAQVNALKTALGEEAIVGTVDKFQGREAPIVIYSTTSSSADDAPRGISFLYEPNRLNVASSRAKCCFIMVANPRLFEAECSSPKHIAMVNGMCYFKQLATVTQE